jgi:hypothetical protein
LNCPKRRNDSDIPLSYSRSYFSFDIAKTLPNSSDYNEESDTGIMFVTFSEKISETTSGYDVIGFYISFILVIGNLLRNLISGEETRIILTEMPEPEPLITLCEGITITRYKQDFKKEEYFYYVLIDLMRSTEIIKIITKSSLKRLKEKEL